MYSLLMEEMVKARIEELHRRAAQERRARQVPPPGNGRRARWLHPLGDLLVAAGVRAWVRADRLAARERRIIDATR